MYKITRFDADVNLLYNIQQITGHSTLKILGYFQNLALTMVEDHTSRKSSKIQKTMKWTYEKLPFDLYVFCLNADSRYSHMKKHDIHISIKPSRKMRSFDLQSLTDRDAEYTLGLEGAEPVGVFVEPIKKAPLRIKKILNGEAVSGGAPKINIDDLPPELRHMVNK